VRGKALRFNGESDYVEVADSESLDITDGLTLEAWVSPSGWWNTTWQYRRNITIDNTANANTLTNYQVAINLTYDSGMQPDFSDIRFTWYNATDGTETEIPYWIERKVDSSWAYVWVKVPEIPPNSIATVYVYYGNTTPVSSESNAKETMLVYDDFSNSSEFNEWSKEYYVREGSPTFNYFYVNYNTSTGSPAPSINMRGDQSTDWASYIFVITRNITKASAAELAVRAYYRAASGYSGSTVTNARLFGYNSTGPASTSTEAFEHVYVAGGTYDTGWKNGGEVITSGLSGFSDVKIGFGFVDAWGHNWNQRNWYDNIIVRQYVSPEPTYSIGAEEEIGGKIVGKGTDAYELQATGSELFAYINNQVITTKLTNAWHHVVETYDRSYQNLYVDGKLKASKPLTGAISTNTNNLVIGKCFNGIIDEVRIYNRALSAEEIQKLYLSEGAPTPPLDVKVEKNGNYAQLTWNTPESKGASAISEYAIYRSVDGGTYEKIATLPSDKLIYEDRNIEKGHTYRYYITAINSVGESEKSKVVELSTGGNGGGATNKGNENANSGNSTFGGFMHSIWLWLIILVVIAVIIVVLAMRRRKPERIEKSEEESDVSLPPAGGFVEAQTINVVCPHCGYAGEVPASMRGQTVKCPNCGNAFKIE